MEDAHTTHLTLCDDKHISFFAVYDGHGGDNASKYCNQNLYVNVMETNDFKQGNYKPALKTGFLATDEKLLNGIIVDLVRSKQFKGAFGLHCSYCINLRG